MLIAFLFCYMIFHISLISICLTIFRTLHWNSRAHCVDFCCFMWPVTMIWWKKSAYGSKWRFGRESGAAVTETRRLMAHVLKSHNASHLCSNVKVLSFSLSCRKISAVTSYLRHSRRHRVGSLYFVWIIMYNLLYCKVDKCVRRWSANVFLM